MSKIKIFSLGGLNEIGKNMYVVEVDNDIFVFDAGLKHADDNLLGIDYIIPSVDYLKQNVERIKGIFITHSHDEQMGALPDIVSELKGVNIYATPFNLDIIKREFEIENIPTDNLVEIQAHKKIDFGNNSVFPINVSHSVPDSVMYVLNTQDGAIVYTGNFLFDPAMPDNYKMDIGKIAYVGKQGVLCLLCESVYADKKGYTSPQHRASKLMTEILNKTDKRILFNVFQGQIYRIQELLEEVKNTDKKVIVMGKKLKSVILKAIDDKLIDFDKSRFLDIHSCNSENVIIIISDDREKPFSNINRIVSGYDKFIKLNEKDTVIFASPVYPGMEKSSTKLFDSIARIGSELVIMSSKEYLSLHASSEDLMLMMNLLNPKYYFPVIGEYKDQVENANCAETVGISKENILLKLNGQVVQINDKNLVESNEIIHIDDVLIDGKTVGDVGELVIKDREILSENGVVIVSTTLDKATKKVIAGPEIYTRGFVFVNDNKELIDGAITKALEIIKANTKPNYIEYNKVKSQIREELGKYFYKETECNPMILLLITEV
ncbi:MAG: ribonuclease J [Bacilli bacterium]|nr:ribonuclease J [Bacilli bacterium]